MQRTRLNGGARRAARWAAIATGVFATSLLWLTPRVTDAQMYFPFPYIADTELQVQNGAGDEVPSVGGVHRLMLRAFQQTLWLYGAMSDTDYMLTVPVVDGDYVSFTGWTTDGGTTAATDRYWVRKWTLPADLDPGLYAAHCTIDDPGLVADDPSGQIGVQLALAAVTEVVWQKHHATNRDLDDCPNNNGSKRIFPDKLTYNDAYPDWRRRVNVEATVEPPIAGITVYFRVWDVDDPSSTTAPVDPSGDITGPDNRGQAAWVGEPIGEATTTATTDSNGLATATLIVSMQPGDNYRVTAACINHSTGLGSQGSADFGLTPPVGAMTEMLTVWRKLHVERDAMAAPSTAVPGWIFDGDVRLSGTSTIITTTHLQDLTQNWLDPDNGEGQLIGGMLNPDTSSGHWFEVAGNTVSTLQTPDPELTTYGAAAGDPYSIDVDDPDPGGDLPLPPLGVVVSAFAEVYTDVVDIASASNQPPFVRNTPELPVDQLDPLDPWYGDTFNGSCYTSGWDSSAYRCCRICTAYDGPLSEDNDPDSTGKVTLGATINRLGASQDEQYAFAFSETHRDALSGGLTVPTFAQVVAHEIGHQMGLGDIDADMDEIYGPCLMNTVPGRTTDTFCDRYRSVLRGF